VIDGELVALDEAGRPSFNILQGYGSSKAAVFYYVFDVLVLAGKNVTGQPLSARRELLSRHILTRLREPIRECPPFDASLSELFTDWRARPAVRESLRRAICARHTLGVGGAGAGLGGIHQVPS